jgi:predicted DCC family thiol-disulfide oxidoreductase YuxK
MITVFYDGACGLCAREIAHYRRIAPKHGLAWIDITQTPQLFTAKGYKVEEGLKALHVEDGEGKMHVGVAAFIVIWQKLPRWRLLAMLASLPLILPLLESCYRHFARWRFKRLGYDRCRIAGENNER